MSSLKYIWADKMGQSQITMEILYEHTLLIIEADTRRALKKAMEHMDKLTKCPPSIRTLMDISNHMEVCIDLLVEADKEHEQRIK